MKRAILLLAALALLVAGCGSGPGKGGFDRVVYRLTGGIAGLDQQIVIEADGTFETSTRGRVNTTGNLTEEEMAGLRERLKQIDWSSVQPEYTNPDVADAIFESVTVEVAGETRSFTVGTEAEAPEVLIDLVGYLKTLMARHRMA